MQVIIRVCCFRPRRDTPPFPRHAPGGLLFVLASSLMSVFPARHDPPPADARDIGLQAHAVWLGHPCDHRQPGHAGGDVAGVVAFVIAVFTYFGANNNGVEFFVETEPENAIVYVRARGNLSLEDRTLSSAMGGGSRRSCCRPRAMRDIFAFAGDGGLNNNTGGADAPADTIGQIQIDLAPWGTRPDGNVILDRLAESLADLPASRPRSWNRRRAPPAASRVAAPVVATGLGKTCMPPPKPRRAHFEGLPGLTLNRDTPPPARIDWQIDVDVVAAGRYGADVATVGAMVQLVTRRILLDTMRVPSSDEGNRHPRPLPRGGARALDARQPAGAHRRRHDTAVKFRQLRTRARNCRDQPHRPVADLDVKADVGVGPVARHRLVGRNAWATCATPAPKRARGPPTSQLGETGWRVFSLARGAERRGGGPKGCATKPCRLSRSTPTNGSRPSPGGSRPKTPFPSR